MQINTALILCAGFGKTASFNPKHAKTFIKNWANHIIRKDNKINRKTSNKK